MQSLFLQEGGFQNRNPLPQPPPPPQPQPPLFRHDVKPEEVTSPTPAHGQRPRLTGDDMSPVPGHDVMADWKQGPAEAGTRDLETGEALWGRKLPEKPVSIPKVG